MIRGENRSGPRSYTMVGLGEILWDLLPEGRKLGGAPANFAYHAQVLGNRGLPASRVGSDALGREIIARLAALGIGVDQIQIDSDHPTGTVEVSLDGQGLPRYRIQQPAAWDFIEYTASLEALAAGCDAVCFGSLAQRSPDSRRSIQEFIAALPPRALRVFDVNLRQSFYSAAVLHQSLGAAGLVKLNHEELPLLLEILDLDDGRDAGRRAEEAGCRRLLDTYELELVCLTRGERGSLLVTPGEQVQHPGFTVSVVDTVGAGDAFTAALVHHILRRTPLAETSAAVNRYGAWVATQAGATPQVPADVLAAVL
jgi:fructokinase